MHRVTLKLVILKIYHVLMHVLLNIIINKNPNYNKFLITIVLVSYLLDQHFLTGDYLFQYTFDHKSFFGGGFQPSLMYFNTFRYIIHVEKSANIFYMTISSYDMHKAGIFCDQIQKPMIKSVIRRNIIFPSYFLL